MLSPFFSFLQAVVRGKHSQCPQEASASSPAPSDMSTSVSPELSSNGAFLYSYGNFIEQAPLGQIVNIVENQDGVDQNARTNAGAKPQVPGTKSNDVQVQFLKFEDGKITFYFWGHS